MLFRSNRESGSTFFLGEILVDIPLPVDEPQEAHCGTCQSCIDICPTRAITAPYQLDARRCISYLTIENPETIPLEFRRAIGNRVYGCDDCQLICPWNKFAKRSTLPDFAQRHGWGKLLCCNSGLGQNLNSISVMREARSGVLDILEIGRAHV